MDRGEVTVLLVGDVAASRPEPGRLFEHVAPLFRAADIAFGNQEWALSDRGAPWPGKAGRVVRCPPNGVEALTAAGFDVVSLANNHTMNYGPESLLQTIAILREAGIATCGAGANREEAHRPAILERRGMRVAFLAYTSIFIPGFAATAAAPGQATVKVETSYRLHPRAYEQPGAPVEFVFTPDAGDHEALLEDVRRAKEQADVVVVSWHWGDSIGTKRVLSYQRDLGKQVIEAGADVIAGQGVHVLQGVEVVGRPHPSVPLRQAQGRLSPNTGRGGTRRGGPGTRCGERSRTMSVAVERREGVQQVRAYCSLCSVDCPIVCTLEQGRVAKVEADLGHPLGGAMCVKGRAAPELLYHPDRLKYPLRRTRPKGDPDAGWERVSWDEALEAIAQRLLAIRAESGPQAVAFPKATNGGTSLGDSDRWLRRLASAFGSPNQVSTTHVCNWHKDTASKYTYGVTIPKPDFERTQCVILWGHNPSATSIDYAIAITQARKRGAKLVVIDPRRVGLAGQADCWLPVRPGADGALALSLIHVFIEEGLCDAEFVRRWTNGPFLALPDGGGLVTPANSQGQAAPVAGEDLFAVWDDRQSRLAWWDPTAGAFEEAGVEPALERLVQREARPVPGEPVEPRSSSGPFDRLRANGIEISADLCPTVFDLLRGLAAEYAPERAAEVTGVAAAEVRRAARLIAANRPVCYYAWNGVGQHTNATQTSRAISTFYALTGSFDAPGGNVIYKGVATNDVAGWGLVPQETALLRLGRDERPLGPPADPGAATAYDLFHAIRDGEPYRVRAALSFGANTLLSSSDSALGREALAKLEFFAIAELFMTPTAELADIVLPVATFLERPALKSETEKSGRLVGHLRYRPAVVAPLGEARSDDEICFDLAVRLGLADLFWGGDIEAAYRYQLAPSGVSLEELKRSDTGIVLETPPRFRKHEQSRDGGAAQGFATPTRRIELFSELFARHGYDPLPRFEEPSLSPRRTPEVARDYPLILTNAKDTHYNHSQMRGLPALRRALPHPPAEIHADTAAEYGLAEGDWVLIETPYGATRARVKVTRRIRRGVVCANHGWWQANEALGLPGYDPFSEAGANLNLVFSHDRRDPISGSLPYRAFLCRLRVLGPES